MKFYKLFILGLLLVVICSTFGLAFAATDDNVYVINISNDIGAGVTDYIERALNDAEQNNASLIIELNTYGGYVNAADDIKNLIVSSPVETICFINDKAISAGALIALSCDKIIMSPAATMGAAEPRLGEEKADNKTVSYWAAQLSSAAERNGRDGQIAAAMADSDIVIENLVGEGQLLTLTANKAMELGYAEGIASNLNEVKAICGLADANEVQLSETAGEKVGLFLTSPVVSSVLLTLGIAGLVLEIFFTGFSIPGIIGIVALTLYFIGGYLAGASGLIVLVLFLAALVLLGVEIFVTPGFGVAGVLGIISLFGAIVFSSGSIVVAFWQLLIAVLITILLVILSLKWGKTRKIWNKLVLSDQTSADAGYNSQPDGLVDLLGAHGVAITPLRPAGTGLFNGKRIDVVTDGEFLAKNTPIEVIKVDSARVVVGVYNAQDELLEQNNN